MDKLPDTLRQALHDAKQPLNVIGLACANMRERIDGGIEPGDRDYLVQKLGRIDEQARRALALLEALAGQVARTTGEA